MIGNQEPAKTACILFGGRSSEHEISLRSALFVLKHFPADFSIIPVGIHRSGALWSLEGTYTSEHFQDFTSEDLESICIGKCPERMPRKIPPVPSTFLPMPRSAAVNFPQSEGRILNLESEIVFPVLHGPNGEDGRLQGLLEMAEMAYVGCGLRSSVIGIDKHLAKRLAKDAGVRVNTYRCISEEEWRNDPRSVLNLLKEEIGFPCFVKPNALGSAVGVGKCLSESEFANKLETSFRFDSKALVEELMHGTEVEVAFLGTAIFPRVSLAGEVVPKDFYDYESKYVNDDGASLYVPARLDPAAMQTVRELAVTLAKAFDLNGLCRLDFWYNSQTKLFTFNEINTLPGLTSISMFPKLWDLDGVSGNQWIRDLLTQAQKQQVQVAKKSFEVS